MKITWTKLKLVRGYVKSPGDVSDIEDKVAQAYVNAGDAVVYVAPQPKPEVKKPEVKPEAKVEPKKEDKKGA